MFLFFSMNVSLPEGTPQSWWIVIVNLVSNHSRVTIEVNDTHYPLVISPTACSTIHHRLGWVSPRTMSLGQGDFPSNAPPWSWWHRVWWDMFLHSFFSRKMMNHSLIHQQRCSGTQNEAPFCWGTCQQWSTVGGLFLCLWTCSTNLGMIKQYLLMSITCLSNQDHRAWLPSGKLT